MEPREIDRLVAEKVLGLHVHDWAWNEATSTAFDQKTLTTYECVTCHLRSSQTLDPPAYSTDIATAWDIVRALSDRYHWRIVSPFAPGEPWFAGLTTLGVTGWNGRPDIEEAGDTAPMAIALAALRAVGVFGVEVE